MSTAFPSRTVLAFAILIMFGPAPPAPVLAQSTCPGLVLNADFSQGNSQFQSDYAVGCALEQEYMILQNANACNPSWQGHDHTSGSGHFMVVNGAIDPNQVVWRQTVAVLPNLEYELSGWVMSVDPRFLAVLKFLVNGEILGSANAPAVVGMWEGFAFTWSSGNAQTATISIIDETLLASGNDFGIDDLCFISLTPVPVEPSTWGSIKSMYK